MDKPNDFSRVSLATITPNRPCPADLYVKVGDKTLKFLPKGEGLLPEKYNLFLAKHVDYLYVRSEDLTTISTWIKGEQKKEIDTIVKKVGEEYRPVVEKSAKMEEKIFKVFSLENITEETMEEVKEQTQEFVSNVRKFKTSLQVIANLVKLNPNIAGHSVNVANLSIFMAMLLGNSHQMILENVYLGALLHDYAKAKIAPEILENKTGAIFSHAINMHPMEGSKIMRKLKKMPEPVFTIIEQHEEQHDGSGYPKGLKGDEIYSLASIVSFANVFDNIVSENFLRKRNNQTNDEMIEVSLKAMKYNHQRYKPLYVESVLPALEMALLKKEHPFNFAKRNAA